MPLENAHERPLLADLAAAIRRGDPRALRRIAAATGGAADQIAARLHIHASTTRETLTRALADAVPSLARVVPEAQFAALARAFIFRHPPATAALYGWGDELPDFLAAQATALEWIALARLDRAWMAAFFAAEAEPTDAAHLTGLSPEAIPTVRLTLHPSVRLVRLPGPWFEAWCARRALPQLLDDREPGADGSLVAVWRPRDGVRALALRRTTFAFLTALHAGATLLAASEAALGESEPFDLQGALSRLFDHSAFAGCLTEE